VAAPLPIYIAPEFPELLVPELKTNMPLLPAEPALTLRTITMPLLDTVPSPLAKLKAPPVTVVLRPAKACIEPPAPLVPLPTATITAPARPPVATPEPIKMLPELPRLLEPELK